MNESRSQRTTIRTTRLIIPLALAIGAMLGVTPAAGQFEGVYGGPECVDGGEAIAEAYAACGYIAGYLSVGYTYSTRTGNCRSDKDVFLNQTDAGGGPQWQYTVDFGGNDHAYDVKRTSDSGFIVVGTTENLPPAEETNCFDSTTATNDIFLLKLDKCGTLQWSKVYGTRDGVEYGYEVIEVTVGANAGDFVVAGSTQTGSSGRDALIFRTSPTGALLWDQTYGSTSGMEEFFSLTEATAGAQPSGDIIATGRIRNVTTGLWDLYLVRVNSANGTIGAAPQGSISYGGAWPEMGTSVIELQMPPNAGDIVVTGWAEARPPAFPFTSREILVLKTGANVCAGPTADMLYGDQGTGTDAGMSIREITGTGTPGNLIITGQTAVQVGFGSNDAFLMEIVPAAVVFPVVTPALGIWAPGLGFKVYGGTGFDIGRSVLDDGTDYVFTGSERSNKAGGTPADPEQLYLVKASAAGASAGCEKSPTPLTTVPGFAWICNPSTLGPVLDTCDPDPVFDTISYDTLVCGGSAPRWHVPGYMEEVSGPTLAAFSPNPLHQGDPLRITLETADPATTSITVYDLAGAALFRSGDDIGSSLSIDTTDWPVGVYFVSVKSGDHVHREKVVILDE